MRAKRRKSVQGQGDGTRKKESLFPYYHRFVAANVGFARNNPCVHFDITCGSFENLDAGVRSNAALFIRHMLRHRKPLVLIANDSDAERVASLQRYVQSQMRINRFDQGATCFLNGDSLTLDLFQILRQHSPQVARSARGSVCSDFNGQYFPHLSMSTIRTKCPYMDFLISFDCGAIARDSGVYVKNPVARKSWGPDGGKPKIFSIKRDILEPFGKRTVLITRAISKESNRVVIVSTGLSKLRPWPENEFYSIDSDEGQEIVEKVEGMNKL